MTAVLAAHPNLSFFLTKPRPARIGARPEWRRSPSLGREVPRAPPCSMTTTRFIFRGGTSMAFMRMMFAPARFEQQEVRWLQRAVTGNPRFDKRWDTHSHPKLAWPVAGQVP